jgi:hypothetical protein
MKEVIWTRKKKRLYRCNLSDAQFIGFIIRRMPITRSLLLFPNNYNGLIESAINYCNFFEPSERRRDWVCKAEEEANSESTLMFYGPSTSLRYCSFRSCLRIPISRKIFQIFWHEPARLVKSSKQVRLQALPNFPSTDTSLVAHQP